MIHYKRIGAIGNYYGYLWVAVSEGKYYWLIENFDTNFDNIMDWDEIPKYLYDNLIKYDKEL